ncbi:MAG: hypothetical protein ACYC4R_16110 [Anaerolineae bacterium]
MTKRDVLLAVVVLLLFGGVIAFQVVGRAPKPTATELRQAAAQVEYDNCLKQLDTLSEYRVGRGDGYVPDWARDEYQRLYKRCESLRRQAAGEPAPLFGW